MADFMKKVTKLALKSAAVCAGVAASAALLHKYVKIQSNCSGCGPSEDDFDEDRNGCLICLRNDCEKTLSDSNSTNLHSLLLNYFEKVEFTDTVKPYKIHFRDRYKEVYEKLLDFSKAEVIVTDRLHGMIFAFLTNTPCIILNSKSPKLKGCYEWIKKSKNLIFLDDYDENKIIDFILKMDENSSDNDFSDIDKQYECMKDYIRILIK